MYFSQWWYISYINSDSDNNKLLCNLYRMILRRRGGGVRPVKQRHRKENKRTERERESMNSGYHCDDIFGKKKENNELQIRKTWLIDIYFNDIYFKYIWQYKYKKSRANCQLNRIEEKNNKNVFNQGHNPKPSNRNYQYSN